VSNPTTAAPFQRAKPWRAVSAWLSRVPIEDPVDRRNAPMLQIVLLMLGSLPPLAWAYRLSSGIPWRPGETLSLSLSLALSGLAIFSFILIRRGRLQWAVRQLMAVVAAIVMLSYAGNGFDANRFEHPVQVMWLVIAGLMIGRKALWLMYGWIVLAFVVGAWRDVRAKVEAASSVADFGMDAAISAVIFLFIAIVVDRSVAALRESLQAATQRGDALDHVNQRLHAEIFERERVQTQLVHAQKVEAVGRLASGVAHDFNHLLGLMLGYAERGRKAADIKILLETIEGMELAAKRARAVSRKLLSFSRHDDDNPQTFDLREALRDVQPMLRQLFDPSVRVHLALPEQPAQVHIDRAQFDLAILNIAANADQAMPDGGAFNISVRADDNDDGFVAIELRDTGQGMDDAVRAQVFDPFFTTKPRGEGTGLGLAVTRDLIVKAGGDINVVSAPGQGATFTVRLPVAASGDAQAG
jgi:signal transduction histidine kinase